MGTFHVAALLCPMSTDHTADAPGLALDPRASRSWCSCGPVLGGVPRSLPASDSKAHLGLLAQCPPAPCCRRGCESICHLQNSLGGESPKSSKGVPRSGETSKNKHAHDPSASHRHVMHRPILVTGYTRGPLPVLLSAFSLTSTAHPPIFVLHYLIPLALSLPFLPI